MSHANQSGKAIYQCPPITPTLYSTTTYEYNKLGQLDMAAYANGVTTTYTYSNSQNFTCPQDNYRLCTRGLYVGSYTYPTSSILPHAVQTAGGNTFIYDDNGNMTSGAGRTIIYDYDNRPVNMTAGGVTTTFLYDGGGARVKKTSNGVSAVYIGKLYENTPDGCIKYIFAGDQRIAMRDAAGSLFYYHTDHLGSSSVVTDAAGNMVERIAYFPYGQTRINTGTKDVHHKFTGQELDAETGLYFYGARYYDPQLGRFISADSIVPNPREPQDLNRYTYAGNNPLLYTDPTGHFKLNNFLKSVVSGVVGGAAFVLSGGNPVLAGMAAGAAGGAMSGDARNIFLGAAAGSILGGFGAAAYNAFGMTGAYGMLAAGGGAAYQQGGWDGVAYFAGGVSGGMAGAYTVQYAQKNWVTASGIEDTIYNKSGDQSVVKAKGDQVAWNYAQEHGTTGDGLSSNVSSIENTVDGVFNDVAGRDATVTYTTNGTHSPNSLHYNGNAIDLRTRDLSPLQVNQATESLRNNLGTGYDVINESNHIHIEYDPR